MGTNQSHRTGRKTSLKLPDIFYQKKKKRYFSGWKIMITQLFCFSSLNKFIEAAGTVQPGRYIHSLPSFLAPCRTFNSSDSSSQISPQPCNPVSSSPPCSAQIPQENRQVTAIMLHNHRKARQFPPLC